jgi:hypothetical protein
MRIPVSLGGDCQHDVNDERTTPHSKKLGYYGFIGLSELVRESMIDQQRYKFEETACQVARKA